MDPSVVTEVIKLMKSHSGELTVAKGKKYRILRMNIEINRCKNIEIEMKDQLLEVTCTLQQANINEVNCIVTVPSHPHLRDVNLECTQLSGEKTDFFIP